MALAVPMLLMTIIQPVAQVVLVPGFAQIAVLRPPAEVWRVVSGYLNWTFVVLSLACACIAVAYPAFLTVLAPGFVGERLDLTHRLSLILLTIVPLSGVREVMRAALLSLDRYALQATDSLIQSLVGIIVIFVLARSAGVESAAYAFLLAVATQLVVFGLALRQRGFRYQASFDLKDVWFRATGCLVGWPLLGALASQGVVLVERTLSSLLPIGSVASLAMARRILFMLSEFIVAPVRLSVFPHISRSFAKEDVREVKKSLEIAVRLLAVLSILAGVVVFALRVPLTALLFQRGAFDAAGTTMLSMVLGWYVLALPLWGMSSLLSGTFYAAGEPKLPTLQLIFVAAVNLTFDFWLLFVLGTRGIPIAFISASAVSLALSIWLLMKIMGLRFSQETMMFALRTLVSGGLTYIFLRLIVRYLGLSQIGSGDRFAGATKLVLSSVLGSGVFGGLLWVSGGKLPGFLKGLTFLRCGTGPIADRLMAISDCHPKGKRDG
jgi:putative peptidoglycan lipid II flippase